MIDEDQAALFSALGREWDSPVPLDAAGRARWRAHALAAIRPVQLERDLDDGVCAEFVDGLLVTGWSWPWPRRATRAGTRFRSGPGTARRGGRRRQDSRRDLSSRGQVLTAHAVNGGNGRPSFRGKTLALHRRRPSGRKPRRRIDAVTVRVKFIGAVDAVTGSCSLVHNVRTDTYYLVDCGMFQGRPDSPLRNAARFERDLIGGVPIGRVKAVLLTHAHLDHCGLIPALYRRGFTGQVICTRSTATSTKASLLDAVSFVDPGLFSIDDVHRIVFKCPDAENPEFVLGHLYPLEDDFFFGLSRSAHAVGGVGVQFCFNETPTRKRRIMFSGDVGPVTNSTEQGALLKEVHEPAEGVEYLVLESTYGGRVRDKQTFEGRMASLGAVVNGAFGRSPTPVILVSTFSLQRAHELLFDLAFLLEHRRGLAPNLPATVVPTIVLDSTLAAAHGRALREEFRHVNCRGKANFVNREHPLLRGKPPEQVEAILDLLLTERGAQGEKVLSGCHVQVGRAGEVAQVPRIIIASSGMCSGGRIVEHLHRHARDPGCTIVLTGYQAPGTPGAELKALQTSDDPSRFSAFRKVIDLPPAEIRATVCDVSALYSGHADTNGLLDFALLKRADRSRGYVPLTVFLVHGEQAAKRALRARLQETAGASDGVPRRELKAIHVPAPGSGWFDICEGRWIAGDENDASGALASARAQADSLTHWLGELHSSAERLLGVSDETSPEAAAMRAVLAEVDGLVQGRQPSPASPDMHGCDV
jgi:metallo-beta-lactamase family protein